MHFAGQAVAFLDDDQFLDASGVFLQLAVGFLEFGE